MSEDEQAKLLTRHSYQEEFDALVRRVASRKDRTFAGMQDAIRAIADLRKCGVAAVPSLCRALEDEKMEVRIAANALREVGDERAVRPLIRALRASFLGRSPGRHLVYLPYLFCFAIYIWYAATNRSPGLWWLVGSVAIPNIIVALQERARRTRYCRAITRALQAIALRAPTRELHSVLPDLKTIAGDVVHQDRRTREASRKAAAQIEALAGDLPLPATHPAGKEDWLPRPAGASEPEQQTLPRVAD